MAALSAHHLDALDTFLIELNHRSADVILPLFRAENGLENKAAAGAAFDPVTAADRGAEAEIRRLIAAHHPQHGVIGEEYGADRPDAEFVWVLDPIDGTRAFIAGLPLWTTLIGLRWQGQPVLGSIGQPFIGEIFIGDDRGSRLITPSAEQALKVRACPSLSQAVIATTDSHLFKGDEAEAWSAVRTTARLARYGCDAYAYAMVAMGTLDLVVETGLKAWDTEAAVPVIAGAGGHFTDWRGGPVSREGRQIIIAGDQAVLDETVARLSPAAK